MSALAMGTLFPPEIEQEVFSKVKGHSSLAKMARQEPLKFTGKDVFVLSFDSDVSEKTQKSPPATQHSQACRFAP